MEEENKTYQTQQNHKAQYIINNQYSITKRRNWEKNEVKIEIIISWIIEERKNWV